MNLEDVGASSFTFPICINEETNPKKPRDFSAVIQVQTVVSGFKSRPSPFLLFFPDVFNHHSNAYTCMSMQ